MTTPGEGNALELAARRLERAVAQLEQKLTAERAARPAVSEASASASASSAVSAELLDAETEKAEALAAELETAKARERALEEAGEQASEALGRAIAEIRAALGDEALIGDGVHDEDEDDGAPEDLGPDLFAPLRNLPEREA